MYSKIESSANEKVKLFKKVATLSKTRRETGLFALEGQRLCLDAVNSEIEILTVFFTHTALEKWETELFALLKAAKEAYEISAPVAEKLSDTKTTQGVFCLCRQPEHTTLICPGGKYLALEQLQDPANLGAVCRTAEALGIDGAILYGCCDIYNPKAQRAAMGSLLRLPLLLTSDLQTLLADCKAQGMHLYAAMPDAACASITDVSMDGGVIAVIGNEGNGVSDETAQLCERITIPMRGRAESLNASMAAAITMWEMLRKG